MTSSEQARVILVLVSFIAGMVTAMLLLRPRGF